MHQGLMSVGRAIATTIGQTIGRAIATTIGGLSQRLSPPLLPAYTTRATARDTHNKSKQHTHQEQATRAAEPFAAAHLKDH